MSQVEHFIRMLIDTCKDTGLSIMKERPPVTYLDPQDATEGMTPTCMEQSRNRCSEPTSASGVHSPKRKEASLCRDQVGHGHGDRDPTPMPSVQACQEPGETLSPS